MSSGGTGHPVEEAVVGHAGALAGPAGSPTVSLVPANRRYRAHAGIRVTDV
ncbi:hypothetical protein [Geodermatophilus dictyosporus]|uniref:hypothetical protein n=1 Tax=Geodermatophilus dictyosporus TaxID=1523247 RepID=UPI00145C36E7|nr:hypothetical protein [Geodermatophilus dictyosporus]